MQRFSLVDSWRETHPSLNIFTWNNKSFLCRIDLYIPSPLSDHKCIYTHIPLSTTVNLYSTPSYWNRS